MSILAIAWAFKQQVGNPLRKFVLIKIADNANDQGLAWPSIKVIAEQTEMSKRSVIRHIKELEKQGLLKTIRPNKNGASISNHYLLNLNGVVSQCHQGSDTVSLGVVSQCHQGSDTVSLGVVSQCHPNRHIEPSNIKKTTTIKKNVVVSHEKNNFSTKNTNACSSNAHNPANTRTFTTSSNSCTFNADTLQELLNVVRGTDLEGFITEKTIRTALKAYNPEAHVNYQPEMPAQGIKRILDWMQHIQLPENPAGFLVRMAREGMDKPATVARTEQAREIKKLIASIFKTI